MLSEIFPTGWHGVELAKIAPGETIVIYGAGPVGLMAADAAQIKGAAQVFVVDQQADWLKLAEQIGATPIDRGAGDAVAKLTELTGGGADRGIDAGGYQAPGPDGNEQPEVGGYVRPGGALNFTFGDTTPLRVHVDAATPDLVTWTVLGYATVPDWTGTALDFALAEAADGGCELAF